MSRIIVAFAANAVLVLSVASGARAQELPFGPFGGWMGEFNHSSNQLLALAEATPAEKFAWRPADGVRSIAEVYMHIAVGNYLLLEGAGVTPPVDPKKLGAEPEKSITDKTGVITFLKDSFDAVRAAYPSVDQQEKVQIFGISSTANGVLLRLLVHNHEHMGQAIAYARMNGIAPPWS
jgi:uncharacterized damage-inducible protein DinB